MAGETDTRQGGTAGRGGGGGSSIFGTDMSGEGGRLNSQREIASLKIEALARAFEAEGLGVPEENGAQEAEEGAQSRGEYGKLQTLFDLEHRVRESSHFGLGLERNDSPVKNSSHGRNVKWVGQDANLLHRFLSKDCESIERMKVRTEIDKERCLKCMHGKVHSSDECKNANRSSLTPPLRNSQTPAPSTSRVPNSQASPIMEFAQTHYVHSMRAAACDSPGIPRSTPKRSLPGHVCRLHGDDAVRHWGKYLNGQDAEELIRLNLERKGLKEPPGNLNRFRSLQSLNIAHNSLRELPAGMNLPELVVLDVSYNELTTFPVEETVLPSLEKLNLSRNKISAVGALGALVCLKEVNISENELSPSLDCSGLSHLQHLYLHKNRLQRLDGLGECSQLVTIFLRNNLIEELRLPACSMLLKLDCGNNRLKELPEGLFQCRSITSVWLFQNCIEELPISLGTLQSLAFLDLRWNRLKDLPKTLPGLAALHTALLGHNLISDFPVVLCNMASLRILDLSHNLLREVHEDVATLTQLSTLDVRRNRLMERPRALDGLGSCKINLEENPFMTGQPIDSEEARI